MDEVKTPQHDGTPRSHAHARVQKMPHVVEVVEADEVRTVGLRLILRLSYVNISQPAKGKRHAGVVVALLRHAHGLI